MKLMPITVDISIYPTELQSLLLGAKIYGSSSSPEAKVIFFDLV